ncbi:iron-containing alcohol dehydrogenase [Photobacterium leiognathi]|uniref:iron-containing alcohol dehydrogenase n=1 Tax=Photobacterium leiognathi TaxID=553611 RepID=UPI002739DD92|nr:iron-containing alcohol dehydrogenase [Photobacterium leiognathi]
MSTSIILPRIMQIGEGASDDISSVVLSLGCYHPLIVTDKVMVQLGYIATIQSNLRDNGIESQVYDETIPEPTTASLLAGVDLVRHGHFDSIIAVGGGSPIDSAKAISILGIHGGQMRDYKVPRIVNKQGLPVIAIPTTAGTGSEATRFTVITDEKTDEKMLCMGNGFMPTATLLDFNLTLSAPPRVTADTGIDALTHAIEAYVSRKANQYSDFQALTAMRLLTANLRAVFHDGYNKPARKSMMLGAHLAGVAFSNASVALVHGMSRPIGAAFHVPHGLSNAMLLPAVTRFSIPAATERYADCARAMGIDEASESDKIANEKLITELESLNEELKVPSLAEFGVERKKFFELMPLMAEQALASGSPDNNPVIPTSEQIIAIYQSLWDAV